MPAYRSLKIGIQEKWWPRKRLDALHPRHQPEQAPQAEDDRRHGGQQVEQVAHRPRDPTWCVLGHEQRHAQGYRPGDDQGDDGRLDGAEGQGRDAEAGGELSGCQALVVKKLAVSCENAGSALMIRKTAIAASSTRTKTPAAMVRHLKTRSPRPVDRHRPRRDGVCRFGGLQAS